MSIVKKLDDPIRFAKIPEPPKTKPTLAHQKEKVIERISVLYNIYVLKIIKFIFYRVYCP